jgi:hypothetical protein
MFSVLCNRIGDLADAVITGDALHAQKSHADYLVPRPTGRGAARPSGRTASRCRKPCLTSSDG